MSKQKRRSRGLAAPGTFVGCLRHFLTPALLRQVHAAHGRHKRHRECRWGLHALVVTLALFGLAAGDSQQERFEVARSFYVNALAPKRKRPGKTVEGFRSALARLPMYVLRLFAAGLRRALLDKLGPWLSEGGFIPIGCDGSRLACPRTAELERRLGTCARKAARRAGKKAGARRAAARRAGAKKTAARKAGDKAPQMWLTAMVHLGTGLLWSWRLGKSDAGERDHLLRLLPTLPPGALLVTDAGFYGVDLARSILHSGADFLMRVGSKNTLYAELVPAEGWRDGVVMLWTKRDQDASKPPLFLRLIRAHDPRRKVGVWLLTSVLRRDRLSAELASRFYTMRWENEGFFRSFKKTLRQLKLAGRTVRQVHREAEGALLAAQLLLAQGAVARAALGAKDVRGGVRAALLGVRREMRESHKRRGRRGYRRRLGKAGREDRPGRRSAKVKRRWDSRHDHEPPRPPDLRTATDELIAKLHKVLGVK
jgi:hypothetical protein